MQFKQLKGGEIYIYIYYNMKKLPINAFISSITVIYYKYKIYILILFFSIIFGLFCKDIYIRLEKMNKNLFIRNKKNAEITKIIKQDKIGNGELVIPVSYSFWMYINKHSHYSKNPYHILSRGDSSPDIYFIPYRKTLNFKIRTTDGIDEFNCPNIPILQWIQIFIILTDQHIDVYLNNKRIKTYIISSFFTPIGGDIIINNNGGYNGYIQRLKYYPKKLLQEDINKVFNFEKHLFL